MALGLTLLLWPLAGTVVRRALVVVATVLVSVVVLDRVFLGVHYPSDVVAGMLFGGGLTLAASRLWPSNDMPDARHSPRPTRRRREPVE